MSPSCHPIPSIATSSVQFCNSPSSTTSCKIRKRLISLKNIKLVVYIFLYYSLLMSLVINIFERVKKSAHISFKNLTFIVNFKCFFYLNLKIRKKSIKNIMTGSITLFFFMFYYLFIFSFYNN